MAMIANIRVVNLNGLSRQPISIGASKDWKDLEKWLVDQEAFFKANKVESDQMKIRHIIMTIDVRHWSKLENYFRYNQQSEIKFDMVKSVLLRKVKRIMCDPLMKKYEEKVDGYIDKVKIAKLDLNNLQTWLRKLRFLCDGKAKDSYLTSKILDRLPDNQLERCCTNLLKEIKAYIDLYETRIKINSNTIGKEKRKELKQLQAIQKTIKDFISRSI